MDASALLQAIGPVPNSQGLTGSRAAAPFTPRILRAPARVRLATLAREAAQHCLVRPRCEEFYAGGDGPILSRELLALLTFSYGTRLYLFERIYDTSNGGILCRSLIQPFPHPSTLRAFRKMERPAVVSSLETFLESVSNVLGAEPDELAHAEDWLETVGMDCRPTHFNRETLRKKVEERVNQATWTDRMVLDY